CFMIDARYQRRGIGKAALEQVIAHVRTKDTVSLLHLSYVPEPGNPAALYQRYGFQPTGEVEDGEVVLALSLT
ncbi:MAG: GNAT family N-acetyltransferase, partial [Leptolyngbya sp. SIO1D8]|nr:GNAT family N-acetyltransferase [Leptolyngbya sp. SIO1D8]